MLRAVARFWIGHEYPHGLILWGDWEWVELPSPSSQMWPTSRARRLWGEWTWHD